MRLVILASLLLAACSAVVPSDVPAPVRAAPSPSSAEGASAEPVPTAASAMPSPLAGVPGTPVATPIRGPGIDLNVLSLMEGEHDGTGPRDGGLILRGDGAGRWTSAWREPGFVFSRLVPSWNADTPDGTWITVEARARRAGGGETRWYSFGTWTSGDRTLQRSTVNGQRDGDARIVTDTLLASTPLVAYQVRVTLARSPGSAATPALRLAAAVASDDAAVRRAGASAPGGAAVDLDVPAYSQEVHAGQYPQYAGGGEAWCSPTSVAMVLAFWKTGPSAAELAWVDRKIPDPSVPHAARATYDAAYRGTGNWAFNTAYAASFGLSAFVTQLRSLAEAERFIRAGIPLVVSVSIPPGGLPGFLFPQGTDGHILVVRGFTARGDVIANDPAAVSNAAVRIVYPRAAFERVWIGGSGGITYVIHPADLPLPDRIAGATPNW
jgi:hypothetical protein